MFGASRGFLARFNEASALQRRKLLKGFFVDPSIAGFNEASALQRRKHPGAGTEAKDPAASMRPPLFSGGNHLYRRAEQLLQLGFNEASALQRRKLRACIVVVIR